MADFADSMSDFEIPTFVPERHRERRDSGPDFQMRRRRAGLAVIAGIALLVGIIAGASSGGGGGGKAAAATKPPGWYTRVSGLGGKGSGSLSAKEQRLEDAAVDRTLATVPFVQIAGSQHREMALTFDDGPGPFTSQVLDVLRRTRTRATFFVVGTQLKEFSSGTVSALAQGLPIADHTETHANLSALSASDQRSEIVDAASVMKQFGVPAPRLFRPPYGAYDNTTKSILKQLRMVSVLWTIDTKDYTQPGVDSIVSTVLNEARPGAIVLMHDAGGPREQTVAALPQIIKGLRAKGYKLVTVPKLLLDNPPPTDQSLDAVGNGDSGVTG
jgi:peptidoglycan/xylan/chitin deacetylase (PgdA/CDA1 family)